MLIDEGLEKQQEKARAEATEETKAKTAEETKAEAAEERKAEATEKATELTSSEQVLRQNLFRNDEFIDNWVGMVASERQEAEETMMLEEAEEEEETCEIDEWALNQQVMDIEKEPELMMMDWE